MPIGAPARDEQSAGICAVTLKMARVGFYWIGAPENYEIGAIANFAEGTCGFADLLNGHDGRPMANGCSCVDIRAKAVGEIHSRFLAGSAAARQAPEQW